MRFWMPTGVKAPDTTALKRGSEVVHCQGTARSCKAHVSIAGGASSRKISISLTDTNFKLKSVRVFPSSSRGDHKLTGGYFRLGSSEYDVTLNAVPSNPKGAHLILTFGS
jgi:hypothetical protein